MGAKTPLLGNNTGESNIRLTCFQEEKLKGLGLLKKTKDCWMSFLSLFGFAKWVTVTTSDGSKGFFNLKVVEHLNEKEKVLNTTTYDASNFEKPYGEMSVLDSNTYRLSNWVDDIGRFYERK